MIFKIIYADSVCAVVGFGGRRTSSDTAMNAVRCNAGERSGRLGEVASGLSEGGHIHCDKIESVVASIPEKQ